MKKPNIAELLKDCPKGMELYSTIYGTVYFEGVRDTGNAVLIDAKTSCNTEVQFYPDGKLNTYYSDSEITLFPSKNVRSWEGFHRPFVAGDVIYTDKFVAILSNITERGSVWYHCYYCIDTEMFKAKRDFGIGNINSDEFRFATEEEKQKLFDAIKANGYNWNAVTKTLEKLVESNEDVDDKVVMSGIYFDRENYADEVELHLGNYEIEIRDNKTYAVFKNQKNETLKKLQKFKDGDVLFVKSVYDWIIIYKESENDEDLYKYVAIPDHPYHTFIYDSNPLCYKGDISKIRLATEEEKTKLFQAIKDNGYYWNPETKTLEKLVKPKFKVGDRIKDKNNRIWFVVHVSEKHFDISRVPNAEGEGSGYFVPIEDQDEYELVPDKFDIATLKPFDKVLVRVCDTDKWIGDFYMRYDDTEKEFPYNCVGNIWSYCIPYEGNEHLFETANDCDEFFKIWE